MRRLRALADQRLVAGRVAVAATFLGRLRGLMFRPPLAPEEGLWISPCSSVHTAFCRGALDVVFLDGDGRVLRVARELAPWRLAFARGARSVLELAPGAARDVLPGMRIDLV